jgi:hypothetical protein
MTVASQAIADDAALLVVVAGTTGAGSRGPFTAGLSVLAAVSSAGPSGGFPNIDQASALTVYTAQARRVRDTMAAGMAVYQGGTALAQTLISQAVAAVVYRTGVPFTTRSSTWVFSIDGHPCYVLDLGEEGTFVFDLSTGQWSKFVTDGFTGWNMRNGTMFGNGRVIGGDSINGYVWEMRPDLLLDEGFRTIQHSVSGRLSTRSRLYLSCAQVRVTGSAGAVDSVTGATMSLRFSDDNGNTWFSPPDLNLVEGDFGQEMAWTSLGSFMAPGRIFEISDVGGLVRIDGADAGIDNFDGE